jgi:hypothetical protein
MESLIQMFETCKIDSCIWQDILSKDIKILASKYHNLYDMLCFVPYENMDNHSKKIMINYLQKDNNARTLLSNQIIELYPNSTLNFVDIDSIMDYYIDSLELTC